MQVPYNLGYSKRLEIDTSEKPLEPSYLQEFERVPLERKKLNQGATNIVKLWQFDPENRLTARLQTHDMAGSAEAYLQLAHQPKSTWTHKLDLRPMKETF